MRILHISDLHIDSAHTSNIKRALSALAQSVVQPIDHVVATGDIAYHGNDTDYSHASEVLNSFLSSLSLSPKDATLVPGNHDVNRQMIDEFLESGYRAKLKSGNDAASIWSDPAKRKHATARQADFYAFCASNGYKADAHAILSNGFEVGFAPLNSAWRASADDDKGLLFVGTSQLMQQYSVIKDCDIRIALLHHPIGWLHEEEQDEIRGLLGSHFHIVCYGHRHSVESSQNNNPREHALYLCAKAIWNDGKPVGAHVIDLSYGESRAQVDVLHMSYVPRHNCFTPDTEISDNGRHTVSIAVVPNVLAEERQLVKRISRERVEVLQRTLKAIAPSFVESLGPVPIPPLLASSDRKKISVSDVASSNDPLLILGDYLSGKTTTLLAIQRTLQDNGLLSVILSAESLDNSRDLVGFVAKSTKTSRSQASKVLSFKPQLLVDDVDLTSAADLALLDHMVDSGYRVVAAAVQGRLIDLTSAQTNDALKRFQKLDIQPVPLSQIAELGKQIEKIVDLPSTGQYLRRIITESFDSALPRQPWIVLVFFEALVGNQIGAGVTLSQLLLRYTAHRLASGLGHLQLTSDIPSRVLGWLAREFMNASVVEMTFDSVTNAIDLNATASDLSMESSRVLHALIDSGLLGMENERVFFSFPSFQEFFYAVDLASRARVDDVEVTTATLPQVGGALAFLSGLRDCESIATQVFEVTRSIRLNESTIIEPSSLHGLERVRLQEPPDDDKPGPTLAQLDDESNQSAGNRISRRNQLLRNGEDRSIENRFITCYTHSLTLLRHSVFLTREQKDKLVTESIDNTISLVNFLLRSTDFVRKFAEQIIPDEPTEDILTLISAVLVHIGATLLAQLGCNEHLEHAVVRVCKDPQIHFSKRFLAIAWYTYISGSDIDAVVDEFIGTKPPLSFLLMLQTWLTVEYQTQLGYTGERQPRLRSALIATARAAAIASGKNSRVADVMANEHVAEQERKSTRSKNKS